MGSPTAFVRMQPQAHDVGATGAWLTTLARARAAQRTLSAPPAALCGVPWQQGVGPVSPTRQDAQQPDAVPAVERSSKPGSPAPASSPTKLNLGRRPKPDLHHGEAGRGIAPTTPPRDPPAAGARGSPLHSPEAAGVEQKCREGDGVSPDVAAASQAARVWLSSVDAAPSRLDRVLRGSDSARPLSAGVADARTTGRGVAFAEVAAASEAARAWLGGVGAAAAGADMGVEGISRTTSLPAKGRDAADGAAQTMRGDKRRQPAAEYAIEAASGAEARAASAGAGSGPQRPRSPSGGRGKSTAWRGLAKLSVAAAAVAALALGLLAPRAPPGPLPAEPRVGRRVAGEPARRRRGEVGAPGRAGARQDRPRAHLGLWWPVVPLY